MLLPQPESMAGVPEAGRSHRSLSIRENCGKRRFKKNTASSYPWLRLRCVSEVYVVDEKKMVRIGKWIEKKKTEIKEETAKELPLDDMGKIVGGTSVLMRGVCDIGLHAYMKVSDTQSVCKLCGFVRNS